jgi:formate dehydrogenase major subunit
MFCELDPQLAAERGIEDGGWMTIVTERAEIEARAKVTHRVRPLRIDGRTVHQISMPWHWGSYTTNEQGVTGDAANDLVVLSGDPNVSIEDKSFSCDVRPGRRGSKPFTYQADPSVRPNQDDAAEHPHRAAATPQSTHDPDLGRGSG